MQIVKQRVGRGAIPLRERPRMKHDAGAAQTADMHPLMLGQIKQTRAPDVVVPGKVPTTDTAIFSRLLYRSQRIGKIPQIDSGGFVYPTRGTRVR